MEAGRGGEFKVGSETVNIEVGAEEIPIPFGPLKARGSLDEWRKVIDREAGELRPLSQLPYVPDAPLWEGKRTDFPILDSE